MATAKKLPSGQWRTLVYDYTDSNGKRHYESFTAITKKESEYMAAEFNLTKSNQSRVNYRNLTLLEALNRYCDSKSNILSPSTIRSYRQLIKTAYESISHYKLKDINQELVQQWANEFSVSRSPKTVRNAHGFLSAVLYTYISTIVLRTTLPQKKKFKAYIPTDKEVQVLISHYADKDTDMRIASCLAAFGTLRRSEICALNASDICGNTVYISHAMVINDEKKYITKDMPKNTSSIRPVEMPDFVINILPTSGRIVNLNPSQVTQRHIKTLKKLDIPYFRFHDLRHYAASIMHALGIPDQYIMERGGWSSDKTLKEVYRGTINDYNQKFQKIAFDHYDIMQHEMQHDIEKP